MDDHTTTTTIYAEHLDEDDEDDVDLVDEDEEDNDSTSSAVNELTIAVTPKITPINATPISRSDVRKTTAPLDDSRRLFQRLWTDEDEIELLQGFLDFNSSHHNHHDTTAFYDQIKSKLQLDFNKNQLVEKLRRLKKKYRTVLTKITSTGKDYVFKTPHDQITFDISSKIWTTVAKLDDEEPNNPNPNPNLALNLNDHNGNCAPYSNSSDKKTPRPRKRSRSSGVKIEEKPILQPCGASNSSNPIPNVVEETVKSCLLPLFKELVNNSTNGLGGMNYNPMSLSFGGFPLGDITTEKWRKQHILELEVCSKRLELVQNQIKSQLEELRSMRG